MSSYTRQRELPYKAECMFEMVAAIENYPSFLPWCEAVRIQDREITPTGEVLIADMVIRYKVFRERFSSRVVLTPRQYLIDVSGLQGAMRYLTNRWQFHEQPHRGCLVDFFIDFEFKNPVLRSLLDLVFDRAGARLMTAFEERAAELYE
ncbi:MAG: type II toxin-antitoxin system RatA family toxin [Parvularculales bacterium]